MMTKVYYAIETDKSDLYCFLSMSLDLNTVQHTVEDFMWRSGEKWSDIARMAHYYDGCPHLEGVLNDYCCVSEDKADKRWSVVIYERELD